MLRSPNIERKNVHVQQMVYPENTAAGTEQQVQRSIRIFRTCGDLLYLLICFGPISIMLLVLSI